MTNSGDIPGDTSATPDDVNFDDGPFEGGDLGGGGDSWYKAIPLVMERSLTVRGSHKFPGGGLHSVVIDGVEDGMVLIRDPAGSAYEVTIQDFMQQWDGKAVILAL